MADGAIRIQGARTHNLKDLDLDLPREAWTVVCGVSGSGKSSLVLDTLGVESRRRFLGTLSRLSSGVDAWARPDVDRIDGLPPAVTAGFVARAPGPRHTLGTVTEVTHALRVLFARAAAPHCPTCGAAVGARTRNEITSLLLDLEEGARVVLLAPRGTGADALEDAGRDGFVRVRVAGGEIVRLEDIESDVPKDARVEVVVDRLVVKPGAAERFAASVDQGLDLGGGVLRVHVQGEPTEETYADRPYCGACDLTWPRLSTQVFSFTSPYGACPACEGRGVLGSLDGEKVLPRRLRLARVSRHLARHLPQKERDNLQRRIDRVVKQKDLDPAGRVADLPEDVRAKLLAGLEVTRRREALSSPVTCAHCEGRRLGDYAGAATVGGESLPALEARTVDDLGAWLEALEIEGVEGELARPAQEDALARLSFLREVGLGYLQPSRAAGTLSGGELRRARLAGACAARMSGLLYLLDEPTAGLHPSDRPPLRRRLRALVDEGNTVVCVEHDPEVLLEADHVVVLGPGAGAAGGEIVSEGAAPEVRPLPPPREAPRTDAGRFILGGAHVNNLKDVEVEIPHRGLTCLTGVSGAGKSTLLLEVIAPAVRSVLDRAPFPTDRVEVLEGLDPIERLSVARGAPSRHPRASPGSVLGVLSPLRRLFAATLEARTRGWAPSRFSRHVPGGRCEACRGTGERRVTCDACEGTGYHRETLKVRVKGLSIADVLDLAIEGAGTLFRDIPTVARPLAAAADVGLGYIRLGVPTNRLSGGEALRLRLAAALGRGGHTPTLYLLDEPSAGLHPDDVAHLATVLLRLGEEGNTVVAVEHHPHLVRIADHVVELGPGPGDAGGRVVYAGPPAR